MLQPANEMQACMPGEQQPCTCFPAQGAAACDTLPCPDSAHTCGGVWHNASHLAMEHTHFGPQACKEQLPLRAVHILPLLPSLQHCWPGHPAHPHLCHSAMTVPRQSLLYLNLAWKDSNMLISYEHVAFKEQNGGPTYRQMQASLGRCKTHTPTTTTHALVVGIILTAQP